MKKKRLLAVMSLSALMAISVGALSSCEVLDGIKDVIGGITGTVETTTVTLSESAVELVTGESSRLVATVSTGEKATWASSDESVVTVQDGRLKAVGAGTATITASVGDVKATCTITVVSVEITLDKTTATVERGQTLKLNVTCSKEGELKWTSSDDSVLSVKDGVITAKEEGTATVTVVYGSSNCKAQCEVTVVWSSKPADYEALLNGSETEVCLANPGKFVEWHDLSWCGTNVTVTQAEYMNGGAYISYSGVTEVCWFGMQVFYKNANNVAGNNYELSCNIESAEEGDITINGTVVHLKKGDNVVKVYYMEGSGASLSMQMGVNGGTVIAENQIVIKNLAFADYTPEKLSAPTEFSIGADRVVTVADNNGDKVSAYQLTFTKDGKVVNKVSLQSGESFDDSAMEDGEYQVSVVAVGEGRYQDSDPCATVLTYTVSNGGVQYAMENGGATVAVANPGKYYYWTEFAGIENANYDNGTITFDVVNGGNWYSNQIFYKNPGLTTGKRYTLTLTIRSSVAEQITLNGTVLDLVIGDNAITVSYVEPATDPSFSMQMGTQASAISLGAGSFILSDIVWSEGSGGTVTPPEGGETKDVYAIREGGEQGAIADPGTYYYWTEWSGVTNGKYDHGTVSFEVVNGGNWYSNQIFYKNPDLTAGNTYKLSLKLQSSVAEKITLNGTVLDLVVGENNVEVTYTETAETASLSMQMGTQASSVSLGAGSFILSDIVWSEGSGGTVTPPEGGETKDVYAIREGGEQGAIADPGTYYYWTEWSGVANGKYDHGTVSFEVVNGGNWYSNQIFYKNPDLTAGNTYKLSLKLQSSVAEKITLNGTVLDLVVGENNVEVTYTETAETASLSMQMGTQSSGVSLAAGTFTLTNIAWTQVEGGEVTPPDVSEGSANGDENVVVTYPGKYLEWHDQNWYGTNVTVSKAELVNGEFHLTYSGASAACWFGMQVFYKNASNVAGKTYELTLSINSAEEGDITVNGTVVHLVQGDNAVKVSYTEVGDKASMSIQMGVADTSAIAANTVVIKDVTFTEVKSGDEGEVTPPSETEGAASVTLAWVESYGNFYMHFNATSEYDIASTAYVKVNGEQRWSEYTVTGTGWAFKVYVGDLTLSSYTFEWYDGTGAVVATATYIPNNS